MEKHYSRTNITEYFIHPCWMTDRDWPKLMWLLSPWFEEWWRFIHFKVIWDEGGYIEYTVINLHFLLGLKTASKIRWLDEKLKNHTTDDVVAASNRYKPRGHIILCHCSAVGKISDSDQLVCEIPKTIAAYSLHGISCNICVLIWW